MLAISSHYYSEHSLVIMHTYHIIFPSLSCQRSQRLTNLAKLLAKRLFNHIKEQAGHLWNFFVQIMESISIPSSLAVQKVLLYSSQV